MARFMARFLVNLLTFCRFIPVTIGMIVYRDNIAVFTTLFLLGWVTEGLDGRLARRWGVSSKFGEYFDLTADAVNLFTTFFLLWYINRISIFIFIAYILWVIIFYVLTSPPLGKKWWPPQVWAYLGLSWWVTAIAVNGGLIGWLIFISYPLTIALPVTFCGLAFFWFSRDGCLRWRDTFLIVLREQKKD